MGSLPNLSEIGKEDYDSPVYVKAGLSYKLHPHSFRNDRNRIRYRQSERGELPKYRKQQTLFTARWTPPDDLAVQHADATSSPASSRSAHLTNNVRRRDSLASSIGATSVRRLICVVRNSHNRRSQHYCKRVIIRHLVIFCVCNIFINATLLPFLVLQGSVSAWSLTVDTTNVFPVSVNIGSYLIALMYSVAAISALFSPYIVHRIGPKCTLLISYAVFMMFYGAHLYPHPFLLIFMYIVVGFSLGQYVLSHVVFLMDTSTKMTCAMSDDEELKLARRTVIVRRFARSIQASQDLGVILGSLVVAMLISILQNKQFSSSNTCTEQNLLNSTSNCTTISNCAQASNNLCTACSTTNVNVAVLNNMSDNSDHNVINCGGGKVTPNYDVKFSSMFSFDEHGNKICGALACANYFILKKNDTEDTIYLDILPKNGSIILAGIFIGFVMLSAMFCGIGLRKLQVSAYQDALENTKFWESMKAVKGSFLNHKLQLIAPLSLFVGMEQGFIYSDFSKSYIVCTLGIQHLNLVFLSMGVLQSIAACTLSMVLKSIDRYYAVGVGFAFQCCVFMVQLLWKPMNDDPALFYVIPSVWGVCNAIWEILTFSLLTLQYTDSWSAPFCNFAFFRFLGLAISFVFHGFLCNWIKLYFLAVFLLFAVVPYYWLELSLAKTQKKISSNRL